MGGGGGGGEAVRRSYMSLPLVKCRARVNFYSKDLLISAGSAANS